LETFAAILDACSGERLEALGGGDRYALRSVVVLTALSQNRKARGFIEPRAAEVILGVLRKCRGDLTAQVRGGEEGP
jgi:hypothetical protein